MTSKHLELRPAEPGAAATLGGFLEEAAARFGDDEAIVHYDALDDGERIAWSYARLLREARGVARALAAEGIGKGERVGLLLGNRNEFVAAFFGVAMAGALPVLLSTLATVDELRILLAQAEVGLLLTQRRIAKRSLVEDLAQILPGLNRGSAQSSALPFLRQIVVLGAGGDSRARDWQDFLDAGERVPEAALDARTARVSPSDLGVVIYTSGTTSIPKGVVHYHSTLVSQFRWQAEIFARKPGLRVGSPFPLFWSAGLVCVLGSTLAAGGTYVGEELFEPGAALRLIAREKLNEWYGFPTHTAALAEHPDWPEADLRSMTRVQGYLEFADHPNTSRDPDWNYIVAYGMSESCTLLTSHLSTTSTAVSGQSAGKPLPGVELRIMAPESCAALDAGQEGEICARGRILMPHYLGMRREDSFDADGFFHTGDLGHVDEDGYLHWTGRTKDMIKTGGANVAPAEIERAAAAIGPLTLCRAIGVPDKRLGEMVVLCAVRDEGSDIAEGDIKTALRKGLAAYKVPRRVLFFQLDEYPLTASGKIRDGDLRALATVRLRKEA